MSGSATSTPNPADAGFVQSYQNFQMPANSFWVTPPTQANLLSDTPPQIASLNPSLYYPGGDTNQNTMATYTDPTSGQTVSMAPWPVDPAATSGPEGPLIVSPAIPMFGGTLDQKAGTYSDAPSNAGAATYFNYNLNDREAEPTQQSLYDTYKDIQNNSMGPLGNFLVGLPLMLTASLLAPQVGGALVGALGSAGASAIGAGDTLLGSLGSDVSSLASGANSATGGLLGQAASAYQDVKPYLSAGQDLLKVAQAVDAPQQTQTPPASLLAQPMVHR